MNNFPVPKRALRKLSNDQLSDQKSLSVFEPDNCNIPEIIQNVSVYNNFEISIKKETELPRINLQLKSQAIQNLILLNCAKFENLLFNEIDDNQKYQFRLLLSRFL